MARIAIYAGSFDPVTLGHMDLIERSLHFVDRLIVAIAVNVAKKPLFTVEERAAFISTASGGDPRVEVLHFEGLLVDFARKMDAKLLIRGLRAVSDFEYEYQMALMNRHLSEGLETVFMVPSLDTTYISASLVREVAQFGGDISGLVHPTVAAALRAKFPVTRCMDFIARLRERAAKLNKRIAFVEGHDPRVVAALEVIRAQKIVRPVLVHDSSIAGTRPLRPDLAEEVMDCAGNESGLTPLNFANTMLVAGRVDGVVAGALLYTADVLRSAITIVGRAPGVAAVSGAFYMVPASGFDLNEVLTFADCAVIREPTAEQLAEIAIAAARDRRRIVGDEPIVALLSYSTRGSASGRSVELVQQALELIRNAEPGLIVDGELQGDAALARDVCKRKAPGSPVMGNANILVFPSLDAGNIAYKLVQRIGNVAAIGPILQGLARPCNDLSRGASENDIINVAAITALQSASYN